MLVGEHAPSEGAGSLEVLPPESESQGAEELQ
jgi:hypothetical protein